MLALFKMKRHGSAQLSLELKPRYGWGGARPGAGRKPTGKAGVPHRLRTKKAFGVICRVLQEASDRFGAWIVHFSVQGNHMHLIAEANDERALSRSIKGLQVRIARGLNVLFGRSGRVFKDRYHTRALKTPGEVRHGIAYVILNARKHTKQSGRALTSELADPCSSAIYFDGWEEPIRCVAEPTSPPPVAAPRTWLLRVGWRRRGLISAREIPACA